MAIVSRGYDGSINEIEWAKLSRHLGARHAVAGAADWAPTINAADRTVRIAAGTGYGDGVIDVSDTMVNVQLGTISSGTRWDCIVARRDWQPTAGTTVFTSVAGTATAAIPAGLNDNPGTLADQPIALARLVAGQTLVQEIIDLRTVASKVISADSLLALSAAPEGTIGIVGGVWYRRQIVSGNLSTVRMPAWASGVASVQIVAGARSSVVSGAISHGLPDAVQLPHIQLTCESSGAPIVATIQSRTFSSFTVQVHRVDGNPQSATTDIPVHWLATKP